MTTNELTNPLIKLYGVDALNLALIEISDLRKNSNIPFDEKYVDLGIEFLMLKSKEIIDGNKSECSLHSLISESFGEAAIYKYNCCGGEL